MAKTTSISDIKNVKRCRALWNFTSPLRLAMDTTITPGHFTKGNIMHDTFKFMFTNPYATEDQILDALVEASTKHNQKCNLSEEDTEALVSITKETIDYLHNLVDYDEIVAVEKYYRIPITDDLTFVLKCDLIVRKNGKLRIYDFKTASALPTELQLTSMNVDDQSLAYCYAIQKIFDEPVEQFTYVYINMKIPAEPKILKKGRFSRSKTPYIAMRTYLKAIEDSGQDISFYKNYIEEHTNRMRQRMFRVVPIKHSQKMLQIAWESYQQIAYEMTSTDIAIYPNGSTIYCPNCVFQLPCNAQFSGLDYQGILDHLYQKKGRHD